MTLLERRRPLHATHLRSHWAATQASMTPRRARLGDRWRLRRGVRVQGSCRALSRCFRMAPRSYVMPEQAAPECV